MKKFGLFLFVVSSFVLLYFWPSRDFLLTIKYDLFHTNPYQTDAEKIDEIFKTFRTLSYQDLDTNFIKSTFQNIPPYEEMVKDAQYYRCEQAAIYQKLVGNFRLKDLLPKDAYYKNALYSSKDSLTFILDKQVVAQLLNFQNELEAQNFDRDAFIITNGYRHPQFNESVKGAKQSKHIVGQAIDITAKDINRDGAINQEDKEIILAVAEKIVGNTGGVGRYPNTLSIHIDTRGYKARWDSF